MFSPPEPEFSLSVLRDLVDEEEDLERLNFKRLMGTTSPKAFVFISRLILIFGFALRVSRPPPFLSLLSQRSGRSCVTTAMSAAFSLSLSSSLSLSLSSFLFLSFSLSKIENSNDRRAENLETKNKLRA